ncbi:VOC family protein [Thalassospira sp.]|uniref:VOC family protein n=1 Tax=Thalassospira sp. TaxID=1912094 RepID=UPI00273531C4|nr:VOC family protein [Thalassospira sp.]MDP2697494.1 VOC family protein [Thalassospira sp.]
MKITSAFPIIVTENRAESRAFYEKLGFVAVFAGDWYIHLVWPDCMAVQIGLMAPDHPTQPALFHPRTLGEGSIFGISVEDAATAAQELRAAGFDFALDLRDEPWGQRHFTLLDPNGVRIDIASQDAPVSDEYAKDFLVPMDTLSA